MIDIILFPLKVVLILLDLLITVLTFGWIGAIKMALKPSPMRSVPVADDPSHRVDPAFKANLAKTPREGVVSLFCLAKDSFSRYSSRKCMGTRKFLGWKSPKVKHFGEVQWKTYGEVGEASWKFGAALRKEGLVAAPTTTTLDKITTPCSLAIFENTCEEWMISALGAFSQSMIVTTIYATLGLEAVIDAVNDGKIAAIVCNKLNVSKLTEKASKMKSLKVIIYTNDTVAPDDKTPIPAAPRGVKIISFDDFVASGNTTAFPTVKPTPDTCAVVMYTSGSTGKPKGVIITQKQLVGACASGELVLGLRNGEDIYLGYLPLAHILELMAEFCMISQGCAICYADPKSLTTTGAYPIGALEQYSPTLMAAVPKIWDVIKKGIEAKVAASSPVAQFLVKTAFEARMFAIEHGYDTPLFKALVFKKFSKVIGGNLRMGLSGGGPLNAEVQRFIRTAFGFPFKQGYGLTETCAGLTMQADDDLRFGIAGYPIPSVEVKLDSCPDVCDKAGQPYLSTDVLDVNGNPVFGRGEILVRGTNISMGYYMSPEKTAEVYKADGWFHTGDIGQFMDDGSIRIVDRKKNLVKLKGGEYIALENMEVTYGNSKFVDAIAGGICCYGDGDMDRPIALMQLNEAVALKWAKDNGVEGDINKVKDSKELMDAVLKDLILEHKKGGLSHLEKLKAVAFLTEHWTPENGCLTAANKLQRRQVVATHEKVFEETKKKAIF
uniref:AMP-dependent synthetase/ligase domain-containing protein n=1 Tax=Grammatophora oceanica TaxID=210454 RepID=A0A7S1VIL3_9STRA|mmetsp:Transcript_47525/g.70750  ORF Transcript_47525/g.70750 Transcript_47525/m.70750 type:complete len:721 (-) Transcript_47525:154-2316(-)